VPRADLVLPPRLLAGGGPSSPDGRVLRALGLPLIGQFDPDFTAIMDDIVQLARAIFLTRNERCLAVSGAGSAGLDAVLNSLIEDGDAVAIGGGSGFVAHAADIARRAGARMIATDDLNQRSAIKVLVVPHIDPRLGVRIQLHELANECHARGARLVVDATQSLGACELRVDEWGIDVCVAAVDHGIGAPTGMALVTYTPAIEAALQARTRPPRTSFLDLLQLQAYWSPERLNHHTAPTSLVYGLHEALRLICDEGIEARWQRHQQTGAALRDGLQRLDLDVQGEPPYSILHLPAGVDEPAARRALLEQFGVYVTHVGTRTWRLGLLGADARPDAVNRVLAALEDILKTE